MARTANSANKNKTCELDNNAKTKNVIGNLRKEQLNYFELIYI